jgi:hypothetical protein
MCGKLKNVVEQIECHYCGQLSFIDDLTLVPLQDGPDDCIDVGMCTECAEAYNQDCPTEECEYDY